jgi:3-methyl-2-oxobutanoate hydroxymethyltransferase
MVVHDMLGVSCLEKPPKFIKNFLEHNNSIFEAIEDYVSSVKSSTFPAKENWFD